MPNLNQPWVSISPLPFEPPSHLPPHPAQVDAEGAWLLYLVSGTLLQFSVVVQPVLSPGTCSLLPRQALQGF